MESIVGGSIAFGSLCAAALVGMWLRATLPEHHVSSETKDTVRVAMGLVSTMSALVLGLLVGSANSSYEAKKAEVIQVSAKMIYLGAVLEDYGPEAAETRELLRRFVEQALHRLWPDGDAQPAQLDRSPYVTRALPRSIQKLSPQNDGQRELKALAAQIATDLGQTRWLMYEQTQVSVAKPLLVIVVAWMAIIFVSLGLFAAPNGTSIMALLAAALSVAGAIVLIIELSQPFGGLIRISGEPVRSALDHLAR